MAGENAKLRTADNDRRGYAPTSAVAAGDVVEFADCVGIATMSIPANTKKSLAFDGEFTLPKKSSLSIPGGSKVYWDKTEDHVCLSTAHTEIGKTGTADTAASTTTVDVHLKQ